MSTQPANDYEVKAALDTIEGFSVIGVSIVTTNEDGKAAEDINTLWERFFKEQVGQKVENKVDDVIYAVYSDYEGDHTKPYRVTIGYKTDSSDIENRNGSDSFYQVQVEAGEYGIMSAQGPQPQTLVETWTAVWSSDLNRRFGSDFEVYGPRFFEDGINEVLIYIGLKEEQETA